MSPSLLSQVGEALYGEGVWKSPLADALGVHRRTVLRWAGGLAPIPDISADLRKLLMQRRGDLAALIKQLTA